MTPRCLLYVSLLTSHAPLSSASCSMKRSSSWPAGAQQSTPSSSSRQRLASPWPYLGRPGVAHAADAGSLPLADVLATNDLPDPRRDGQPDSVYNSGALFFRATAAR